MTPHPADLTGAAPVVPTGLSVVQVVRSDAFAGVERYICQVANGLAARGHQLAVIGGDPERMRAELADAIRYRPASSLVRAAAALAAEHHADVAHVHMTAAEGAVWLVRPLRAVPAVATRHFPGDRGSNTVARALARRTSRVLARDIAISRFVAESIEGSSVLIPNGVPDRPGVSLESRVAVMLQRLSVEKAPELGLRAWSESGLAGRGWRLVVAGSGSLQRPLIELAHDLAIEDSVDFVGHVVDTDRLLATSAVMIAPAPAEPFGLSVVEAMAHGVPVVAARGGAHVETVGEDGLLFPPGDAGAAARILAGLAEDAGVRRQVGARLRNRQQRLFSLPVHLDRLELVYREVIAESGRRRGWPRG